MRKLDSNAGCIPNSRASHNWFVVWTTCFLFLCSPWSFFKHLSTNARCILHSMEYGKVMKLSLRPLEVVLQSICMYSTNIGTCYAQKARRCRTKIPLAFMINSEYVESPALLNVEDLDSKLRTVQRLEHYDSFDNNDNAIFVRLQNYIFFLFFLHSVTETRFILKCIRIPRDMTYTVDGDQ